jgi:hypothetical protein
VLWNLATGQILRQLKAENVNALAFSPDGALLAIGPIHTDRTGTWGEGDKASEWHACEM